MSRLVFAGQLYRLGCRASTAVGGKRFGQIVGKATVDVVVDLLGRQGWHVVRLDPATEPDERPIVTEEWT